MREPFPSGDEAFNKSYSVLSFSKLSLYSLGVPVEVLRSLTDEDMESLCNFLIGWFADPAIFTKVLQTVVSVYLTGRGWSWEYNEQTEEVSITKRPGGKQ